MYFAEEFGRDVVRVSAEGGPPEITGAKGAWPRLLPDRKTILVTRGHRLAPSIEAFQLDGGEPRVVVERGGDAHYVSTGHLVFARAGQLLAAPFEVGRNVVTGPALPVLNGVVTGIFDGVQAAFSDDGTVVYLPGPPVTEVTPVWIDANGRTSPSGLPSGIYASPRISPDGDRLAVISMQFSPDVWVFDLRRGTGVRITSNEPNRDPVWTPDGEWVVYRKIGSGIFRRRSSGTGDAESLSSADWSPVSVTPDGDFLVGSAGAGGLWLLPLNGRAGQAIPVEGAASNSNLNRLSPDGKWMALTLSDTGRFEVYVEPFPPTGDRWMISSEGGEEPVWSASGKEVFFRYGNRWMAVSVSTEAGISTGPARLVFEGNFANVPGYSYDVHPRGDRFLIFQRQEPHPVRLHLIQNWFGELKRLVPTE